MKWKTFIRRTLLFFICYIISITLVGLLGYTAWMKYKNDDVPKKISSPRGRKPFGHQPDMPARDAVWQNVDGVSYVYAAYYDDRGRWPNSVRIIGATKAYKGEAFRCRFWYPNRTQATFRVCPFATTEIPHSVSVVKHTTRVKNRLLVINTKNHDRTIVHPTNRAKHPVETSKTHGICVKPLYNNYNNSVQLVEFMELNRILGMDHVTLYKSSISLTTECILRNYIDEGLATFATALPWKKSNRPRVDIRNANALAMLNDCLYRNMHNFSYTAFLDLDEFIVPTRAYTVQQMIEKLDFTSLDFPYKIGSYSFQNGFFYLEWPDDSVTKASQNAYERILTTLLKTTRQNYSHPHGTWSKYIVKPLTVKEVGIHSVSYFARGFGQLAAMRSEGILNHYRSCEYRGSKCTGETSIIDRSVFRYKKRLVEAVKLRWQKLQKSCGMEDIQLAKTNSIKGLLNGLHPGR